MGRALRDARAGCLPGLWPVWQRLRRWRAAAVGTPRERSIGAGVTRPRSSTRTLLACRLARRRASSHAHFLCLPPPANFSSSFVFSAPSGKLSRMWTSCLMSIGISGFSRRQILDINIFCHTFKHGISAAFAT
jgi:hypothetical protein